MEKYYDDRFALQIVSHIVVESFEYFQLEDGMCICSIADY